MNPGFASISETPIAALAEEQEGWEASAFEVFLAEPVAECIFLVELYPFQLNE